MDKSLLQKKFRFVMIIAALALFVTILTPAYMYLGSNDKGFPRIVMMWTVLFGGGKLTQFQFSWFAFTGYLTAIILLIICVLRQFITIQPSGDKKKKKDKANTNKKSVGAITLDATCMVLSFISLCMFILLPILITETSQTNTFIIEHHYGLGIAFYLIYIITGVMFVSSLIVLFAESIVKYKTIKDKKATTKETKVEAKEETKEEQPEE